MSTINWECPFCSHDAIIHDGTEGTMSSFTHVFEHGNKYGRQQIGGRVIVCPNPKCHEYTLSVTTYDCKTNTYGHTVDMTQRKTWPLVPQSHMKVFPDYILKPILDDYNEACLIRDASPRASATLSRRCLQGMIRDFWGISKKRLVDEIDAIKDKVDTDTWDAIDAVRQIGNIGAHMEADINVIVDVDPNEAQLLIELIETLLTEWYVAKHKRQERMAAVKGAAAAKKVLKTGTIRSAVPSATTP